MANEKPKSDMYVHSNPAHDSNLSSDIFTLSTVYLRGVFNA